MIVDLENFIAHGRTHWNELERILDELEKTPLSRMDMHALRRFHYLYERVSSDLARLAELPGEQETRRYLESVVARAYGEIHESRRKPPRFHPLQWFLQTFPRTFRRHVRAFHLSVAALLAGCVFGGLVVTLDRPSREILMPFPHLVQDPAERVSREESNLRDHLQGRKAQGAAWYMTHNTKVSMTTLAMGVTWGIGTVILLFSNGVMLGAVVLDYVRAGQSEFLFAWLLPHGATEIPAILLAGQAGLLLGGALVGRGPGARVRQRLRRLSTDLVTLVGGIAVLLVWSGIVEAFLSQYHEPAVPYACKIGLGVVEIALLAFWLARSGRSAREKA